VDQQVETVVNQRFNSYMQKKMHLGRVKLDRRNRSLELAVQVDGKMAKGAGAVRDLKQLSGGERSYTTVAFTLALGGETSMPFRAMDEFDVFMDAVNRRVAMTNLLTFAREQADLQFIFLTPQDMAAVEEARQVCVSKEKVNVPKEFIKIVEMRAARPSV
jgi:chromosome segregation ATPase